MWTLPKPNVSSAQAFEACISRVSDRAALADAASSVQAAAEVYDANAALTLLDVPENTFQLSMLTADQMAKVYENGMVRQGSPGRVIYDQLMLAPKYGRCPLCGERRVANLDHYLPKRRFWALAVNPANLIPACSDCNRAKLDSISARLDGQPLHPYFDVLDGSLWLGAEVIRERPAAIRFFVLDPPTWSDVTIKRVKAHFSMYRLGRLYGSHASQELGDLEASLELSYESGGTKAVQELLNDQSVIVSRGDRNSWRAATYRAVAADEWFTQEGFRR